MNFTATKDEAQTIKQIAYRAQRMARQQGQSVDAINFMMDVEACHSNGCPLKLAELLAAKDGDFAHDVWGIRRHIDRETGTLRDCFLPRCAQ